MLKKLTNLQAHSRYTLAILLPALTGWLLTLFSVLILGDYGTGLFVLLPFFIGTAATIIYGYQNPKPFRKYVGVSSLALLTYCLGLILFAIEGLICLIMAAPLGLAIAWIGALIGYAIIYKGNRNPLPVIVGLSVLIPGVMGFENAYKEEPAIYTVTTSVVINRPAEEVWEKVIHFSHIAEPTELLFRAGIAYPTHAEIKQTENGPVRYCHFSTGSFVEPITNSQPPQLLEFSVQETPEPMKELSPYDIAPRHLHGYFVSVKGRFQLIRLPDQATRLVGTTWYYHKIEPAFYWKWWSQSIIHAIHNRVLQHIKQEAEGV